MLETAKRMEGEPNTGLSGQKCEMAGKHNCGGAVTLNWGRWLCAVAGLVFSEVDHQGTRGRLEAWMRSKGWTP
jgi:hypothetical protein